MKTLAIAQKASGQLNRVLFKLKKASPDILVGAGVVGVVASAVLACMATPKAKEVVDKTAERVEGVHVAVEEEEITKEESVRELADLYVSAAVDVAKIYAPSVLLGVASLSCVVASHGILRQRNVSLVAAYGALDRSYRNYRSKIAEKLGEEYDADTAHGVTTETVTEEVTDEDTGKKKKVKKTVKVSSDPSSYSPYARFFDETCRDFEKNSDYNKTFLLAQQNYANDLLKARGFLTLNEVYEMLGFEPTSAGMIVGWTYVDPEFGENRNGDNYVDFGIFDVVKQGSRDFVNGYENVILLDFNVDGVIYDKVA